ncbi:hypothetical protein GPECTOR_4g642 [Gonium pectorale]|uniref:cellulase n=1 Tax=Gonium pectorale TaxID=33097 RepID=A0A150GXG0_GONPE|nr:hypothetical protein GPECTOR_4g642 [Gonium pectorale]|eukprot:KXZ54577.1 hypothetical protein GPECTOR_4g642 [Gonium pectorale]
MARPRLSGSALLAGLGVAALCLVLVHANQNVPSDFYEKVLPLSYKFYETQISGEKPDWSRISWRESSHTKDGFGQSGPNDKFSYPNTTLTGGWFGYLKISLTQGAAASLLAYSALTYENALRKISGDKYNGEAQTQWDWALRNVKVAADYLWTAKYNNTHYAAQVGDQYTDDRTWKAAEIQFPAGQIGGPESPDSTTWRPVWSVDSTCDRGADVLGQAVAALASVGVMYSRDDDNGTASEYYTKADTLYKFIADNTLEGVFMIPDGNITILSRTYRDDLSWAAGWLCRAQLQDGGARPGGVFSYDYCSEAATNWMYQQNIRGHQPVLTTDNMYVAAALLLRDCVELGAPSPLRDYNPEFLAMIDATIDFWLAAEGNLCEACDLLGNGLCYVDGFAMYQLYASAHFTANIAFVMLASTPRPDELVRNWRTNVTYYNYKTRRQCWAKKQIDWLLGDNAHDQAYVSGLSEIPSALDMDITWPKRARHRGSSCTGEACVPVADDNPNVLEGALVGGPNYYGNYTDGRNSYQAVVSIEYNSGFTGALLALDALTSIVGSHSDWEDAYCQQSSDYTVYRDTGAYVRSLTSIDEGTRCESSCIRPSDTTEACGLFNGTAFGGDIGTSGEKYLECGAIFSDDLSLMAVLQTDGKIHFYDYNYTAGSITGENGFVYAAGFLPNDRTYVGFSVYVTHDGYLKIRGLRSSTEGGTTTWAEDEATIDTGLAYEAEPDAANAPFTASVDVKVVDLGDGAVVKTPRFLVRDVNGDIVYTNED